MLILSFRNKRIWVRILFTYNAVDFLLVFSGFALIMLNFLHSSSLAVEILKYIFSFMMLFFLPGWLVLRLLKLTEKFHKIAILVISFSVSLGITSILYTLILISRVEPSGLIISITFSALSLIPIVLRYVINKRADRRIFVKNRKKDYNLVEIITLIWIVSFFAYSIAYIYPEMADVPGFDIVRHYATSSVINDHPDLTRSPYPWFHLSLGALNDVTDSDMWLFQSGNSFISIILILAFYCMAKAYLYKFNKYAHLISTIIFTCFSGLGWIFYYHNLPSFLPLEELNHFVSIAFAATYFDVGTGQSQWLWLWFRPITVDFILTILLLFLMRTENLNRFVFIVISSLIIITLSLVHFPGLMLFIIIVFCLAIFVPKIKLHTKDMVVSSLISLPISALVFTVYTIIFGIDNIPFNKIHMIALEGISIISLLLLIYVKRVNIPLSFNEKRIISIVLLIYGILFAYWVTNMNEIKDDIYQIFAFPGALYSIPIAIFPELLGLAGILAIPIIVIILKRDRKNPLVLFPILFISIFVIGRIISYVIINYQTVDYWERRLVPYLWITVSVLSPIAMIKIVDYINKIKIRSRKYAVVKKLTTVLIFFFLILGSMLSTFLSLDSQKVSISASNITEEEEMSLNKVKELDPHSTIMSLTPRSKSLAEFQHFNYNVGYYRDQIWPSLSPELPMNILNGLNSSAVIYLNNADLVEMSRKDNDKAYLGTHVLENAPEIAKNSSLGKIIQIPRLSPPTSSSEMVLVLPNELTTSQYYAYDILSLNHYNFTTALLSDISTIKNAKILVTPSEEIANIVIEGKDDMALNFEKIIILNLDGYEQLGNIEGETLNRRLNHTDIVQYRAENDDFANSLVNLTRQFDEPLDLSKYDIMKLNWVGQENNKSYAIQFSSGSSGYIEYQIKDSWKGAKELLLPMNMTDVDSKFNENSIKGEVTNNPSWTNISKMSIITIGSPADSDPGFDINDLQFVSELKANSIKSTISNDSIKFSQSSIIPITYPSSYTIDSTFDNDIPFILHKDERNYDIYYINIFPLLQNLDQNILSSEEIYSLYDKLLDGLEIDFPKYESTAKSPLDLTEGGIAAFREGTFSGDVNMLSTSSIVNTDTDISKLNIDGKSDIILGLKRIIPLTVDQVEMKTNNSTISGIYGFYAGITSPQKTVLNFIGKPAVLSLISINNEEKRIDGANITLTLDNSDIISRQPKIEVNGVSNFSLFYPYGELYDKFRALGSDLESHGKSSFNIKYADRFILIENAKLSGDYDTSWTDYFRGNENIKLLRVDNLIKIDTLSSILFLVLIFSLYNYYLTRQKKLKIK